MRFGATQVFERTLKSIIRYGASLALLFFLWKIATLSLNMPAYLLPAPERVGATLIAERHMFIDAALYTFLNMLRGAALGIALGILTGCIAAYSRILRWLVEPYLIIFQSFPRESLFPLLIVWIGFGAMTKIVNAALLSFFPIAVITLNGLLDTRDDYVSLIRGWGASRFEEFLHCRLPAFVPTLVSALKVSIPLALIGAVLGEFMGGNNGLGYIIITSGSAFRTDRIFAAVALLSLIGVAMLAAVELLQATVLKRFNQE